MTAGGVERPTTGPGRPAAAALASGVDALLEASVVGSFSRAGFLIRRRLERWPAPARCDGAVAVVTGASSGIGRAIAEGLAAAGAEVWLVGRDEGRLGAAARAADEAASRAARGAGAACPGRRAAHPAVLDVVDAAGVERFAERLAGRHDRLDVLVHAAGGLSRRPTLAPDGTEITVATHVLAPFRLTWALSPLLRAGRARLVTVSSGGMYLARLDVDRLAHVRPDDDGRVVYALAKRAQVALADAWAGRLRADGVSSYALHPGWVDTPGLAAGLPGFTRLGPLLRRPEEGADTAVWLATGGAAPATAGFFHDRHRRSTHRLPWTWRTPAGAAEETGRLWAFCAERTGSG